MIRAFIIEVIRAFIIGVIRAFIRFILIGKVLTYHSNIPVRQEEGCSVGSRTPS